MKVTYLDMLNLVSVSEELGKLHFPVRFALIVARAVRLAREHASDFDKVKMKVLEEEGFDFSIAADEQREKISAVNKRLDEVLLQEIELEIPPICIDDFKEDEKRYLTDIPVSVFEKTLFLWK